MGGSFSRAYGASPAHLALGLASFAVAGFAIVQLSALPTLFNILIWMFAGVVLHDFVLLPIYAGIGRGGIAISRWWAGPRPVDWAAGSIEIFKYIRIPAIVSAILLLMFFPLIFGVAEQSFELTTGMSTAVYLGRWLTIVAVLFAGSGLLLALRVLRHRGRNGLGDDADDQ